MGTFTGGAISTLNSILLERGIEDLQKLSAYGNPLWDRIGKVYDKSQLNEGLKYVTRMQTTQPKNASPRTETGDVILPVPAAFATTEIHAVEFVASTGITQIQLEEAVSSATSAANIVEVKLADLKSDMKRRLNQACYGDGTGRLGVVASVTNSGVLPCVVTLDNSPFSFGWDKCEMMDDGMLVDVVSADVSGADTGTWTPCCLSAIVSSVNKSAGTFTLTAVTGVTDNDTGSTAIADNCIVLRAGVMQADTGVTSTDLSALSSDRFLDMTGLLHIIDDGAVSIAGSPWTQSVAGSVASSGSFRTGYGATNYNLGIFQGLNRASYPMLKGTVDISHYSSTSCGSWDMEDLIEHVALIDEKDVEGKVTALYMHGKMARQLARKAAAANNALTQVNDNKITGGWYTRELNVDGRNVPVIAMNSIAENVIFGVDENALKLYNPVPIGFVNRDGSDAPQPFFPVPGARNMTYEAWLRFRGNLVALRCDTSFRMDGLLNNEA